MCLAVPGKITEITGPYTGEVEFGGVRRTVSLRLLPAVREGDWVLVHAGFAIQVVEEESALETQHFLEEILCEGSQ